VEITVLNSPTASVVAGDRDGVEGFVAECERHGVRARVIPVDYAAHTTQVDAVEASLAEGLADLEPRPGTVPFFSTTRNEIVAGTDLDAGYWFENLRQPVRFGPVIDQLLDGGHSVFVEVSPHPILTIAIQETLEARGSSVDDHVVVGSIRRDHGTPKELTTSLAQLAAHTNHPVTYTTTGYGPTTTRHVQLPTYPFEPTRYWADQKPNTTPHTHTLNHHVLRHLYERDQQGFLDGIGAASADIDEVFEKLAERFAADLDAERYQQWTYGTAWASLDAQLVPVGAGRIFAVVASEDDPAIEAILDRIESFGVLVGTVEMDVTAWDGDRLAAALGEARLTREDVVVSLLAIGGDEGEHDDPSDLDLLRSTVALVQALVAHDAARVVVVTAGAVTTDPKDPVTAPAQTMLWGLGVVAGLELPGAWGALVDLEPGFGMDDIDVLVRLVTGNVHEDQVAVRGGQGFGRRFERTPLEGGASTERLGDGVYLITGGTGDVALSVARWLVARGARRLVLASRTGPDGPRAQAYIDELGPSLDSIEVVAVDVADRAQVDALVGRIAEQGILRGVFHLAGSMSLEQLVDLRLEADDAVVRSKAVGAWNLHQATLGSDLEWFVMFSSLAGVWGSSMQAVYAAANAYLDGLASRRRGLGLPGLSVAWGLWGPPEGAGGRGGMTSDDRALEELARRGMRSMPPATACLALGWALDQDRPQLSVTDVDWATFGPSFEAIRPSPLLSGLIGDDAGRHDAGDQPALDLLLASLQGRSEDEQLAVLSDMVTEEVRQVLRHAADADVPVGLPFKDLGFDSLGGVELANRLSRRSGVPIAGSAVFDHPTIEELTVALRQRLVGDDDPFEQLATSIAALRRSTADPAQLRTLLETALHDLATADGQEGDAASFLEASAEELFTYLDEQGQA
jgi:nucleoside-diphosphate-sugar epimerase